VQLRKSGPLTKQRRSREMLRLLAHAYSELVGGRCLRPPAISSSHEPKVTRHMIPVT
jgi:hypothetical protein